MGSKILVVDDQPGIRLLVEEILKSEGFETISAKTGKQACNLAEEEKPDLVIMDYNLPVMHGREVLNYWYEEGFDSPVIIITGLSEDEVREEVDYSFVEAVVTKPFDIQKLKELVNGTVTHSH
ncbi:response regulator [Halobacillus yeomjeoni]|uniref:response regulator n=1 Tax=Halobacillus yeomjeoni TaxID=311194 RepID=UPI001CD39F88|nr:response regulator [Halobacillus yeomjeoni]MCA0985451.1 response regulator [Halobacillus yeomjeoni]